MSIEVIKRECISIFLEISIRSGEAIDVSFGQISLTHRLHARFNVLANFGPNNREP